MRLEFAEGRLDRVEVWRIRWKVKQLRTCRFDRFRDASNPMSRKIVYDNDVTATTHCFTYARNIGPWDRALKHEWRNHGALPQTGDKRHDFPMPLRSIAGQPLPARTAAAQLHRRVKHALLPHPSPARTDVFRALLLRCV